MKNKKTGQCECNTPIGSGDNFCQQCGGKHNIAGIPDFQRPPLHIVRSTEGLVYSDKGVKTYLEVDKGQKIQYIGKTIKDKG